MIKRHLIGHSTLNYNSPEKKNQQTQFVKNVLLLYNKIKKYTIFYFEVNKVLLNLY